MTGAGTRLSVVLITSDGYSRLRKSVASLRRQPECRQMELIIASPSGLPDAREEDWSDFARVLVVKTGPFRGVGHPSWEATRHASAPIVVYVEDHAYVGDGWAAMLLKRHEEGFAAVAPAMLNGNPGPVSWADFLLNFGPVVFPIRSGTSDYTPWHHTSYKRELLLECGADLERMLAAEVGLETRLLRAGHRMWVDGGATVSHVNLSLWRSFLRGQFVGGRLYGAMRAEAETWSVLRRLLYVVMAPLIPLWRAPRVAAHVARTGAPGLNIIFLAACVCGLTAATLGEVSGYLFGEGSMRRKRAWYEFSRESHVRPADIAVLHAD